MMQDHDPCDEQRPTRPGLMALRIGLLVAACGAFVLLALWLWPSVAALQSDLSELHEVIEDARDWRDRNPALAILLFVAGFSIGGMLPLPVVSALTLAGGAFFGFWLGMLLSVLATTISAALSFVLARHVLNRPLRRWLGSRATAIDRTVAKNGALALLSLRLTPALPFFLINLVAGVSRMELRLFAPITAAGVLPNKAILSAAGTQLIEIQQISDIFGPRLVLILAALALFPWLARWTMRRLGAHSH